MIVVEDMEPEKIKTELPLDSTPVPVESNLPKPVQEEELSKHSEEEEEEQVEVEETPVEENEIQEEQPPITQHEIPSDSLKQQQNNEIETEQTEMSIIFVPSSETEDDEEAPTTELTEPTITNKTEEITAVVSSSTAQTQPRTGGETPEQEKRRKERILIERTATRTRVDTKSLVKKWEELTGGKINK